MGCDTMIPMTLRATLQNDLVLAMKAGDDIKKTTLRAVITAVKTGETAEGVSGELDDAAIMKLIATEISSEMRRLRSSPKQTRQNAQRKRSPNAMCCRHTFQSHFRPTNSMRS